MMLTWYDDLSRQTSKGEPNLTKMGDVPGKMPAPLKVTVRNFEDAFEKNIYASVYCNETLLNGPYTDILHTYLFLK
jgi:hypothetical protein